MKEGLSLLEQTQNGIYMFVLICLALLLFVGLMRAVKGPQVADRLVAVNMMGTIVMVMLAVLALLLGEDFLLDICLIYAMVSFLSVIVLSKVYIGIYEEKLQSRVFDGNIAEVKEEKAKETKTREKESKEEETKAKEEKGKAKKAKKKEGKGHGVD